MCEQCFISLWINLYKINAFRFTSQLHKKTTFYSENLKSKDLFSKPEKTKTDGANSQSKSNFFFQK